MVPRPIPQERGAVQAAVVERYGPPEVVRIAEVPRPEPGPDQVLVRVASAAVTSADARIRGARFPPGFGPPARLALGLTRPRRPVLGSALAGEVEAVGARVEGLAPGDRVCAMTGTRLGAHAQYAAVPATRLALTPPDVGDDEAAGVLFGGTTALHFLRRAGVGHGSSVLVNGASGAVGTNAVQLARHLGATVTGVTSTANVELVAGLGADRVVDRTREDLAAGATTYDVVLDAVGNLSIASGRRLRRDGGTLVLAVAGLGETLRARGDVVAGSAPERVEDVRHLLDLVARGELTVVVDRVHDLAEIAEAHRRVDGGRKVGNVLVHP